MRVAIVHYHLHPGGVTRVIQNAVGALTEAGIDSVVLTGELPEQSVDGLERIRHVPGLGYDRTRAPWSPHELSVGLQEAAVDTLGSAPDVWHIHNHSLGKNMSMAEAVVELARAGHHLFLQIHDFAEDGRPENYRQMLSGPGKGDAQRLTSQLYPQAGQVHYAVLNGRDLGFLAAAGFAPERLQLLPNAVWVEAADEIPSPPEAVEGRLWLYPTRAIRRKNLGEFLLLAALAPEGDRFATTLAPKNPLERSRYEQWVEFAHSLELPVTLGVAEAAPERFGELVHSAYSLVTTSVAEGFGLAYLEPWLLGRSITGRDLPELTAEFREAGVKLDGLYPRLEVPIAWLPEDLLGDKIAAGLERYQGAYGRKPKPDDEDRVLAAWVRNELVDFGRLDEACQELILSRVATSKDVRKEIRPMGLPGQAAPHQQVANNRRAILENFGLHSYGRRLVGLYERLLASPIERPSALTGQALLDEFLAPERLNLLRT